MNDFDAHTFMNDMRRKFLSAADYEAWLEDNVLYKPIRVLIKARQEQFKGENRQRFYAIDVSRVSIKSEKEGDY